MAVERKKEKQKMPAELAAAQTEPEKKASSAGEEPKRPARQATKPSDAAEGAKPKDQAGDKPEAPAREPKPGPAAEHKADKPRERREPTRPVVRAQAKYVRSSARKARLVIEHIRGRSVEDARAVLRHTPRAVAQDLEKLLDSAVANAENNHELVGDDLVIKDAHADEGPTIKRFRPRARGRAARIRKRTSHLTLTLTPKE